MLTQQAHKPYALCALQLAHHQRLLQQLIILSNYLPFQMHPQPKLWHVISLLLRAKLLASMVQEDLTVSTATDPLILSQVSMGLIQHFNEAECNHARQEQVQQWPIYGQR